MQEFSSQRVLIAPYTAMSNALKTFLEDNDVNVIGFIDKNRTGNDIYKLSNLNEVEYDVILILSPNHFNAIYDEYIQVGLKEKIYKVEINNNQYDFLKNFDTKVYKFQYNPLDFDIKREKFVFISKGFISSNNKFFYLYCYRNDIDCIMLTDNQEQLKELKLNNLPVELLQTKEADYSIAIAKFIVFDQGNYTYLPTLHKKQKSIQLWHGVGLKKMAKNTHITYDYFVSTSHWTNETNFEHIFSAKHFLDTGYPRNDILDKKYHEDELDLLFCDQNIYEFVKVHNNIALYMPTHRENKNEIPLDFEVLNEQLQKVNFYFIVKLHPHVLEYYKSVTSKNLSNILFHNANGDIYPILKYVDVLISDYSSIVYDFLLVDKPIIFFNYDMEEYNQNMPFLFDYDEYSPGVQVKNQDEFINALNIPDKYNKKRKHIKEIFFSTKQENASNALLKILQG